MQIVLGVCAAVLAAILANPAKAQQQPQPPQPQQQQQPQPPQPPQPSFTLDAAAAPNQQEVALTVQAPASLSFKIIRSGGPVTGNVAVNVTQFTNEQGVSKRVTISSPGATGDDLDQLSVPFSDTVLPITLKIPELPPGGKYTGRLMLSAGQAAPLIWRFVLTTASELRPATLVVDKSAETISVVRSWWVRWWFFAGDAPTVTVHVRDKTGNWPLEGVAARLEPGLKAPGSGFDFKKHMTATFNANGVADIFASAAQGQRQVPPRGQATIVLSFNDLEAGEYVIPLRFGATNSADDDLQRFTITVQVRDHLLSAFIVLLLAAAMSFLATRVVTTLRQRAAFLARVQAMRPAWLAREPATLPVIWLRATLRQAEDLSRRFFLRGQNELDAVLTGAAGMLAVLDRVRQARERIGAIPDVKVRLRARWRLDSLIQKFPAAALTDQDVARFNRDLDAFDNWCDPAEANREKAYWADLLPALKSRFSEVSASALKEGGGDVLAKKMLDLLNDYIQKEPEGLGKKMDAEDVFARLGLLWESRRDPAQVAEIVARHAGEKDTWKPIEQIYKIVDDGWWKQLNDPEIKKSIEIPAASNLDPPEAYQSIVFKLNVEGDPTILRSYLMQKKLIYRWTVDVLPTERFYKTATKGTLAVASTQPQVAQYSPVAGQLTARVRISYEGDQLPVEIESVAIPVGGSSAFGIAGAAERADLIGFAAVLITSVLSGITIYALAPTFGSLKDYLALFTWGASLDQGKNFVQALAAYNSTTPNPPAAPAAPAPTNSTGSARAETGGLITPRWSCAAIRPCRARNVRASARTSPDPHA